jgi:hypothetical protein
VDFKTDAVASRLEDGVRSSTFISELVAQQEQAHIAGNRLHAKMCLVRDWYIGRAQPSQGCETGSTPVSRSCYSLVIHDL